MPLWLHIYVILSLQFIVITNKSLVETNGVNENVTEKVKKGHERFNFLFFKTSILVFTYYYRGK